MRKILNQPQPQLIPMPLPDDNTIETENNTLFIEDVPATFTKLDEVQEADLYEQVPGYTLFKLFLGAFAELGTGGHKIVNRLQKGNPMTDIVELHISSYGGSIAELLELYNTLSSMYPEAVTTYLNYGYSAGAMAFLFGTDRIIYEFSDYMVHSYSAGLGGKREDMLNHAMHQDKYVLSFFNKILSPYFTQKEIKKINAGKDYWMDSDEMMVRGIATGIIIDGKYNTRAEYLEEKHPKLAKKEAKILEKALLKEQKMQLELLASLEVKGKKKKGKK